MTSSLPHNRRSRSPIRAAVLGLVAFVVALAGLVVPAATADAQVVGRIYYIAPTAAGRADGSSWANAGNLSKLPAFVQAAGPGDQVWLLAGRGSYSATKMLALRHGGAPGAPVTVRGVAANGTPARPLLVGARTSPWVTGGNPGTEVFRLLDGADHLRFTDLSFANIGNGAFYLGGPVTDVTVEHMDARNVRRFVENYTATGQPEASATHLVLRDVQVYGYSRGAVRLQYNSNQVLLEDVHGDSQRQEDGDFAIGVHLDGSVHDVTHRRVAMLNSHQDNTSYWNGDGFASEGGTYNLRYEDTFAAGHTDAGYDLKSNDTQLVRAGAQDSKRNYRFWGDRIALYDIDALAPHRRGGAGSQAQIHTLGTATVTIEQSTLTDASPETVVFHLEDQSSVSVVGATVRHAPEARFSAVEPGSTLTYVPAS